MNFLKSRLRKLGTSPVYQIGRRQVEEVEHIAKGGFGEVVLVRETQSGREYALKKLTAGSREEAANIRREIELMASLPRHKNIVRYLGSTQEVHPNGRDAQFLILMEYCSSGHLVSEMNRRRGAPFEETQVLEIFAQMVTAVAVLHSLDPPLIHRDLKVENLLLGDDTKWKLCDFGSATTRVVTPRTARERNAAEDEFNAVTTLAYRAPEMLDLYRGQRIDTQVDVWALGVSLYKIAFFESPFEDSRLAILNNSYKIPKRSPYSVRLHNLIEFILVPNPYERPDVFDVLDAVCALLGRSAPLERVLPRPPPPEDDFSRGSSSRGSNGESSGSGKSGGPPPRSSIFELVGSSTGGRAPGSPAPERERPASRSRVCPPQPPSPRGGGGKNPSVVVPQLSGENGMLNAGMTFGAPGAASAAWPGTGAVPSPGAAGPAGATSPAWAAAAWPVTETGTESQATPPVTTGFAATFDNFEAAFGAPAGSAFEPSPAAEAPTASVSAAKPSGGLLDGWDFGGVAGGGAAEGVAAPPPLLVRADSDVFSGAARAGVAGVDSAAEPAGARMVRAAAQYGAQGAPGPEPRIVRSACVEAERRGGAFAGELLGALATLPEVRGGSGSAANALVLLHHVLLSGASGFVAEASKSRVHAGLSELKRALGSGGGAGMVGSYIDFLSAKLRACAKRAAVPANYRLDTYLDDIAGRGGEVPTGGTNVFSCSHVGELARLGTMCSGVMSAVFALQTSPVTETLQGALVPLVEELFLLLQAMRTILDRIAGAAGISAAVVARSEAQYDALVGALVGGVGQARFLPSVERLLELPADVGAAVASGSRVSSLLSRIFAFDPDSSDDEFDDSGDMGGLELAVEGGYGMFGDESLSGSGVGKPATPTSHLDAVFGSAFGSEPPSEGSTVGSVLGFPLPVAKTSGHRRSASGGAWPSSPSPTAVKRPASYNSLVALEQASIAAAGATPRRNSSAAPWPTTPTGTPTAPDLLAFPSTSQPQTGAWPSSPGASSGASSGDVFNWQ
ncbi:NAK protein kinase [Thecamonas trahens ATCC 50062]|uniref:non-specific serine/threonine protein kinase n=1 Tax=Thecamonas trahens ATCC 50062 TaxID=461836 RepID=A0A0L0DTF5_THETB|nr:NAK protein kinase [Thecamonas trahens ATCC 50062]KNC55599.1 NAK protein kinase [Thecamonas trahens ATCC 50062]|eukprot:XP_013761372.1 NAK protein kinase [Thecamonas trahens ATCC 50062]